MRAVWECDVAKLMEGAKVVQGLPVARLDLPGGAAPLGAQLLGGVPVLWFDVDPEEPPVAQYFAVVRSYRPVPDWVDEWVATWVEAGEARHLYAVDRVQYELAADQEAGS